jgi:hypothetical protein
MARSKPANRGERCMFASVKLGADFSRGCACKSSSYLLFATRLRYPGIRGLTLGGTPWLPIGPGLFRFAYYELSRMYLPRRLVNKSWSMHRTPTGGSCSRDRPGRVRRVGKRRRTLLCRRLNRGTRYWCAGKPYFENAVKAKFAEFTFSTFRCIRARRGRTEAATPQPSLRFRDA